MVQTITVSTMEVGTVFIAFNYSNCELVSIEKAWPINAKPQDMQEANREIDARIAANQSIKLSAVKCNGRLFIQELQVMTND